MKASDVSLILTTTEGHFTVPEVPQLYVQIQTHRAEIEKRLERQISFEDALYSWMENIYHPIMSAILDSFRLQLVSEGKRISEIYFEVYDIAQEDDFKSIDEAVRTYIEKHGVSFLQLLSALVHHRRHVFCGEAI